MWFGYAGAVIGLQLRRKNREDRRYEVSVSQRMRML